jgi:hypothetical protein
MKRNFNCSNRSKGLLLFLIIAMTFGFVISARASSTNFISEIELLKGKIGSSSNECWIKPAENRKNTIIHQLDEVISLVIDKNYDEAYDKLLHSLKPKLTGLKTNEFEEPWASNKFFNSWVTCEALKEEFRITCNLLLSCLKFVDDTPPSINMNYYGEYNVDDPGYLRVVISDLESGIGQISIVIYSTLDSTDYDYYYAIGENLGGMPIVIYEIEFPAIVQLYTIMITASNTQGLVSIVNEWIELFPVPPSGPGDDPIIIL